jgi:hypothetical protein
MSAFPQIPSCMILKEVLNMQETNSNPRKRYKKFGDLVFIRQFTTFDRQNAASAGSAFHGFFTLFWLATAIFVFQTAAKNWQMYGNILGTNEIVGLMLQRDLMVLGLSDGVMCAATGFCWILQRFILAGYISWNREGWIIQNVGCPRLSRLWAGRPCSRVRTKWINQLIILSSVMASPLFDRYPVLDSVPRMALDPYYSFCSSWTSHAHEATQLCIL